MAAQEQLRKYVADLKVSDLLAELWTGIAFYTRVPMRQTAAVSGADLGRAIWCSPIVGALIGLCGALVYWIAVRLKVPPMPAAALAVGAVLLLTGALHEDGLADTADGFGGGDTRERKLEIMRDSRIGTYGVCALAMSFLIRVGALTELSQVARASVIMWALVAAHAASRALLAPLMLIVVPARSDGLAATAGQPPGARVAVACVLGLIVLLLGLGFKAGLLTLLLMLAAAIVFAWISLRQIGGQTGDVLGAQQQVAECLVLVCAAAAVG